MGAHRAVRKDRPAPGDTADLPAIGSAGDDLEQPGEAEVEQWASDLNKPEWLDPGHKAAIDERVDRALSDFDLVLAELAAERAERERDDLASRGRAAMLGWAAESASTPVPGPDETEAGQ